MSFLLALVALVLVIVLFVTHQLGSMEALLFALLALAILVAGYGEVTGFLGRRSS